MQRVLRAVLVLAVLWTGVGLPLIGAPSARAETWPTTAGSYELSYVTPWDGRTREYRLHLPTGFSPTDGIIRPLVVGLHGGSGNPNQFETQSLYSPKADANNFIVVYPKGTGLLPTWNASLGCCGYANNNNVDDVRFLKDLVARLSGAYTIAANKVFATGHSNGAIMSYRLACDASDVFVAVGVNSGDSTTLHPDLSPCDLGGNTVSIVNLHGDADTNEPYMGGAGSGFEPYVREPVEDPDPDLYGGQTDIGQWTALDGCSFVPISTETTADYVKKTFCGTSGLQIINYKVLGGVHDWYTVANDGISSTDVTWAFFSTHAGASSTLFSDGFESGNSTAGGWTTSGSPVVTTSAAHAGTYGGRLRSTSSITRLVSTLGYTTVTVSYDRLTSGLDSGENLYVEWSTNGTSWNVIETTQQTSWSSKSFILPAGAGGQSGFRVRFRTNASQTAERADLDAISIFGQ